MVLQGSITDTAFLVCESRARRSDLSRDPYARDWIAPDRRESTRKLWEDYCSEVYPYDALEISIRNRFWLDRMQESADAHGRLLLVNLGAGLTSYSFLVPTTKSVEIDHPSLIEYKRGRIEELTEQGTLPGTTPSLLGMDLDDPRTLERLGELLAREVGSQTTFVLLEGVTYYLSCDSLRRIFDTLRNLQSPGSLLGVDFWTPSVAESPVFRNQERFFATRFGHAASGYSFLESDWMRDLEGYDCRTLTDVVEQEGLVAGTEYLADPSTVLFESYAVLRRC